MRLRYLIAVLSAVAPAVCVSGGVADASSHREAPFITKNPKVDSTDFYMFRSYEPGKEQFVTLIANYDPLQDAFGGPNYYTMDPEALYEIHIDNNGDAIEDVTFQFRFTNALAGGNGIALDIGTGANKKSVAVPLINVGPITPGDDSKLNVRESYTMKVIRGPRRSGQAQDVTNAAGGGTTFRKPVDNIGVKSLPDYAGYAAQYLYSVNIPGCATPGRVFVGQRREGFAVNLGPIFDLVDAPASVITGGTTEATRNLVPNPLANKNITSIALEVPTCCLVSGDQPIIGGWQTASVRQARVINPRPTYDKPTREGGAWAQISRLGMPLVNEIVIGLKDKDRFNASEPKDDAQFADYVTNPTLPALLEILFGPTVKAPTVFPRADLVAAFLTGVKDMKTGTNVNLNGATAEYQRLNTALPITAKGAQSSLGAAACFVNGDLILSNPGCDPAGFPNGRRPGDDVVDIELRVAMGYLLATDAQAPSRNVPFTDAVLQKDSQFDATFPYLTTPKAGANGDGT